MAGVALALAVLRLGAAHSLARADPIRAAELCPGNARAATAAARARLESGESASSPQVRHLVRAALRRETAIPGAIELRALDLQMSGDRHRAARLFHLSSAISRRSLPTRLWLIQSSVDAGDVAGALGNFDLALRTSPAAPDILFPVLAGATTEAQLVRPIAAILDKPSEWREMFLGYAVREAGAASGIANVVLAMRDRTFLEGKQIDRLLLGRLIKENRYSDVRRVAQAFGPPASPRSPVRDANFADPRFRYPFGWQLADSAETRATRDWMAGRPVLAYAARPGSGGPVAAQLLLLDPGLYRLLTANAAAPADPAAAPAWTITCAGDGGAQIAMLPQPPGGAASASTRFTVPRGCPAQWLALVLQPSGSEGGQSGAIASVSVTRP